MIEPISNKMQYFWRAQGGYSIKIMFSKSYLCPQLQLKAPAHVYYHTDLMKETRSSEINIAVVIKQSS